MRRRAVSTVVLMIAIAMLGTVGADAQEPIKLRMGRLAFPGTVTIMADVLKGQGLDRKNGIELETVDYGAISPYYAGLAKGEIDVLAGGPHVLQKMRSEGAPIKALATFVRLATLVVVTPDDSIKSLQDLRGKKIAADMGSAEYQILAMYGKSQGVVFGKDVTVVQAGPPIARTQLAAGRVDAAMTWETTATLTLRDNPKYRVVFNGDTAWQAISKTAGGWQLCVLMNEDFVRRYPKGADAVVRMFQDGARSIMTNPDAADAIAQKTVKLPAGVVKEAIASKRLVYEVEPAWGPERKVIESMFKAAVDTGYLAKMPEGAIYAP